MSDQDFIRFPRLEKGTNYPGRRSIALSRLTFLQKTFAFGILPAGLTVLLLIFIRFRPQPPTSDFAVYWDALPVMLFAVSASLVALLVGVAGVVARTFAHSRNQSIKKLHL